MYRHEGILRIGGGAFSERLKEIKFMIDNIYGCEKIWGANAPPKPYAIPPCM